jgi:uncharacterized membrane protein YesL
MSAAAWAFVLIAYAAVAALHHDVPGLLPMFGGVLLACLMAAFYQREA